MTELMTALEKAQEDSLEAIKSQHEQVLTVLKDVVDGFRSYWEDVDTDTFMVIDPRDLVANYMEFSQSLIQETRAFTDSVIEVWTPQAEAKPAPKAAKKAS